MNSIDLNIDMGESFGNWTLGNDESLLQIATSANIACGFHAGDPQTMLTTVRLAVANGVRIGAHPGLPDLRGFGRRHMSVSAEDTFADVVYQIGALRAAAEVAGGALHHVKPHGAYCAILREDEQIAEAFIEAMKAVARDAVLYFPAPTETAAIGRAAQRGGVAVIGEIYPDLAYLPDGDVVIERQKLKTDVVAACEQVERFLRSGQVRASDGRLVPLTAESMCIHGDGPNAIEVAGAICSRVRELGLRIAAPQAGPRSSDDAAVA